jgi:opacity protein-like surface antigen
MKKQILLLVTIFISSLAIAQVRPTFGIRAGVTSSKVSGDAMNNLESMLDFTNGMISSSSRQGFFAGGYASIPVSAVISIEPALYYTQKGYELKGALDLKGVGFLGANAKAKLNTQYLDIPVVLKVNVSGFQLFAGPQLSYLMDANLRTTAGLLGFNLTDKKMDASNQFNRTDFAVTGGVGFKITPALNIMASYDYGLSKVDANKNLSSYNRSFKLGIGMSL